MPMVQALFSALVLIGAGSWLPCAADTRGAMRPPPSRRQAAQMAIAGAETNLHFMRPIISFGRLRHQPSRLTCRLSAKARKPDPQPGISRGNDLMGDNPC